MECPNCGCGDLRVVKTVSVTGQIRRRRECRHCGRRITTSEKIRVFRKRGDRRDEDETG